MNEKLKKKKKAVKKPRKLTKKQTSKKPIKKKKKKQSKKIKTPKQILNELHALAGPVEKYEDLIKAVKTGRPTKYRKEFCTKVIDLAKRGMTLESIALRLGTFYPVMKRWAKKYKVFSTALKKARSIAKDWWIETGRMNLYNNKFNNVLWMMNMTNRFGWTRSELHIDKNVKVKHTSDDHKKVEVVITENKAKSILQILEESGALPEGTARGAAELLGAKVN